MSSSKQVSYEERQAHGFSRQAEPRIDLPELIILNKSILIRKAFALVYDVKFGKPFDALGPERPRQVDVADERVIRRALQRVAT